MEPRIYPDPEGLFKVKVPGDWTAEKSAEGLFRIAFASPDLESKFRTNVNIDSGILASRRGGMLNLFDGGVRQPIGFTIFANNADVAFFSRGLNNGFLNDGELIRRISRQVEDALDLDNVISIQGKLPSFPLLSE